MNPGDEAIKSHEWQYIPWPEHWRCVKCGAEMNGHGPGEYSITPEVRVYCR